MMPLAPTPIMPIPTKPKIGFSIDSIVGSNNNTGFASMKNKHGSRYSPNSEGSDRAISPGSDASYNNDSMVENNRTLVHSPSAMTDLGRGRLDMSRIGRLQSPSRDPNNRSPEKMYGSQMLSPNRSTPSPKHPILVPGIPANIIRPNPMGPLGMPGELKPMQYMNSQEIVNAHNQHFLAAQFQVAAAAALAHNAQHQGAQNAFAHAQGVPPHAQGVVPRDSYPLYPWLLSRHGRIFPHRFPGGPDIPGFLLQPFRKPKRVRTAFSPSQLLKLEHAFESNHYVVGAERKQLAQVLSLTETQVKVWFQNRRTKHKRMQQEEDAKSSHTGQNGGKTSTPKQNGGSMQYGGYDEDELIDMEMDDCSGEESDA